MEDQARLPTPVNVINSAVLACLDDLFYRLPFPNLSELEGLIKDAKAEVAMADFRKGLKAELETPRALQDFESGWDKYWQETQSQEERDADVEETFDDRNRSPSPETGGSARDRGEGGGDKNSDENSDESSATSSQAAASVRWRLFLLLPPLGPLFDPPLPQLNFLSVPAGKNGRRIIFKFDTTPVKCCLSLVSRAQPMSLFISQDRTWCQARAAFGTQHILVQLCSRPPTIAGSARMASCCSGGLDGHADELFQAINLRFHANVHVFTQVLDVYAGCERLRSDLDVYALITQ